MDGNGYQKGQHTPGKSRPVLHRVLYERFHGPIPPRGVVRHADGNPNNFDPANLVLATQNDVARENQAKHLTERARSRTAALLNFKPNQSPHETAIFFGTARTRGRGQATAA